MIIVGYEKKITITFFILGAGAEICPEREPKNWKMVGSGNPALKFIVINLVLYILGTVGIIEKNFFPSHF